MIAQGPVAHEDPEEQDPEERDVAIGLRPHVRGILPPGERA
jgi:hypothetical protein